MITKASAFRLLILTAVALVSLPNPTLGQGEAKEKKPPPLELPSVEIYGEERIDFVILGDKKSEIDQLSFPTYLQPRTREISGLEAVRDLGPKISIGPEPVPEGRGSGGLRAEYGSFTSLSARTKYGGERGKLGYLIDVAHEMSGGHVKNSAYRTDEIGLGSSLRISPAVNLAFRLGFSDGRADFWKPQAFRGRDLRLLRAETGLRLFFQEDMDVDVKADFSSGRITDEAEESDVRESLVDVFFRMRTLLGELLLESIARYDGDFLKREHREGSNHLFQLGLKTMLPLGSASNLRLGGRFFHVKGYSGNSEDRIYPLFEFEYAPWANVKIKARYSPQVLASSFFDIRSENQFVELDADSLVLPRDRKISGELGVELCGSGGRLKLKIGGGFERGDLLLWYPGDDGLWSVDMDNKARIGRLSVEVGLWASKWLDLSFNGIVRDTDIGSGQTVKNRNIPYVPASEIKGALSFGPLEGYRAVISAKWVDERFVSPFSDGRLKSYFLLGLQASKEIGGDLRIFVRGENLLGWEYEVWEEYEMPGIGIYGGLSLGY